MKVTLSRAHHIVSRIGSAMAGLKSEIESASGTAKFPHNPNADQINSLREKANESAYAVTQFVSLAQLQASVREAISKANTSEGISALLAEIEANKRIISLYEIAIENFTADSATIHVSALNEFTWPAPSNYGPTSVSITANSREYTQGLAASKLSLERTNFALNDQLAERNLNHIDINIPEALRECLGL